MNFRHLFFNWLKISRWVHISMLKHTYFMHIGPTMCNLDGDRLVDNHRCQNGRRHIE